MKPEERCDLIARIIEWCYSQTESFSDDYIGVGLSYLAWAIADRHNPSSFYVHDGVYTKFIDLLKAEPKGLFDTLVEKGFLKI